MRLHCNAVGAVLFSCGIVAMTVAACSSSSSPASGGGNDAGDKDSTGSSSGSASSSGGSSSGSSSGSASSSGSSSGGGSSSGSTGSCVLSPGTYSETYTAAAGNSQTCPTLGAPDGGAATFTYPSDGGGTTTGSDGGACGVVCSGSSVTENCSSAAGEGYTYNFSLNGTATSNGATGTVTLTAYGPDGGVFETCSYTLTVTAQ